MLTTNAINIVGMVYNKISQAIADNSADAKTKTVDIMSRKLGIPRTTITRIIDGKVLITNDENIIGRLDDDEFCLKAINLIQVYYDVNNDPDIKLVNALNRCGSIEENTDAEYEADTAELMDITGLSRDTISDILALQQPMTFQKWIVSDMRNAIEDELDANFGKKVNSESYYGSYDEYVNGITENVMKWMNDKKNPIVSEDEQELDDQEPECKPEPGLYDDLILKLSHYNDELLEYYGDITVEPYTPIAEFYDRYMYKPLSRLTGIPKNYIEDVVDNAFDNMCVNFDLAEIVDAEPIERIIEVVPENRIQAVCDEIDRAYNEIILLKTNPDDVMPLSETDVSEKSPDMNMTTDDDKFTKVEAIITAMLNDIDKIKEIAGRFGYAYPPYGVRIVIPEIALTYTTTGDAVHYISTYCSADTLHDDLSIGFVNKLLDGVDERKLTMPTDEERDEMFEIVRNRFAPAVIDRSTGWFNRTIPFHADKTYQKLYSAKHALAGKASEMDSNPTQSQSMVVYPRFGLSKNNGTTRKLIVVDPTKNRGEVKPKVLKLCRKYERYVNAELGVGIKTTCTGYKHYVPLVYKQGTVIIDYALLDIIDRSMDCSQQDKVETVMSLALMKYQLRDKFDTVSANTNPIVDPFRVFLVIDLLLERSYSDKVVKKAKKLIRRVHRITGKK